MGKILKVGKWVPHELTEGNKINRLNTCLYLKSKFDKKDFLSKIVTGDEKWIYPAWLNPGEAAPMIPKREVHEKKALLSIWWDIDGVIYYEVLPQGQTITADRYSRQLRELNKKFKKNDHFRAKDLVQSFCCTITQNHMLQRPPRPR